MNAKWLHFDLLQYSIAIKVIKII